MDRPRLAPYDGDPVAVVGAGPVGQSVALLLARWGLPVHLFDGLERRQRVGSRSICQHREVLDIWEAVGAGRRIAAEGVTWRTARTFYRGHELFCLELGDGGASTFPPFVNISQSRTEEVLDARIASEPLVEQHWGREVTGIEQDPSGVTLTCEAAGGRSQVRASYAVVCAGAHGDRLRAALGVAFEGESFDDRFLICDIRAHLGDWSTERRFYFDPEWNPGRQVLIHPCPGGVYRIDWQVPPDFDLAVEEASGGLDARIRAIVGEAPYEIVWSSVYRFAARLADRFRVGRVLLAGDAAHVMAPFGARGLNSGVADAENAAWKIAFVARGWAGAGLLESYHDERRAAAEHNLEVVSATMRFLVPQDEAERARRRAALERALHDEAARSEVDSGRLYEPFAYRDSPLTTPPAASRTAPLTGALVPDHAVTVPGGRPGRLRELARDGLLVLATDGVDVAGVAATLAGATAAPVRVLAARDLDGRGSLGRALGARPGETWLLRPDAHVAAVLPAGDALRLAVAVRRALGADPEGSSR